MVVVRFELKLQTRYIIAHPRMTEFSVGTVPEDQRCRLKIVSPPSTVDPLPSLPRGRHQSTMRHRKHLNDFGEDGAVISGGSECSAEGSKCWNLPRLNAGTFVWFFLAFSILFQLPIFPFVACQTFNNTKENDFIDWANVDYTFILYCVLVI